MLQDARVWVNVKEGEREREIDKRDTKTNKKKNAEIGI